MRADRCPFGASAEFRYVISVHKAYGAPFRRIQQRMRAKNRMKLSQKALIFQLVIIVTLETTHGLLGLGGPPASGSWTDCLHRCKIRSATKAAMVFMVRQLPWLHLVTKKPNERGAISQGFEQEWTAVGRLKGFLQHPSTKAARPKLH